MHTVSVCRSAHTILCTTPRDPCRSTHTAGHSAETRRPEYADQQNGTRHATAAHHSMQAAGCNTSCTSHSTLPGACYTTQHSMCTAPHIIWWAPHSASLSAPLGACYLAHCPAHTPKTTGPKTTSGHCGPIMMQMRLGFLCPGGLGTRNNGEVRGLLAGIMDGRNRQSIGPLSERREGGWQRPP